MVTQWIFWAWQVLTVIIFLTGAVVAFRHLRCWGTKLQLVAASTLVLSAVAMLIQVAIPVTLGSAVWVVIPMACVNRFGAMLGYPLFAIGVVGYVAAVSAKYAEHASGHVRR